jgi:hypothetical protein
MSMDQIQGFLVVDIICIKYRMSQHLDHAKPGKTDVNSSNSMGRAHSQ